MSFWTWVVREAKLKVTVPGTLFTPQYQSWWLRLPSALVQKISHCIYIDILRWVDFCISTYMSTQKNYEFLNHLWAFQSGEWRSVPVMKKDTRRWWRGVWVFPDMTTSKISFGGMLGGWFDFFMGNVHLNGMLGGLLFFAPSNHSLVITPVLSQRRNPKWSSENGSVFSLQSDVDVEAWRRWFSSMNHSLYRSCVCMILTFLKSLTLIDHPNYARA